MAILSSDIVRFWKKRHKTMKKLIDTNLNTFQTHYILIIKKYFYYSVVSN